MLTLSLLFISESSYLTRAHLPLYLHSYLRIPFLLIGLSYSSTSGAHLIPTFISFESLLFPPLISYYPHYPITSRSLHLLTKIFSIAHLSSRKRTCSLSSIPLLFYYFSIWSTTHKISPQNGESKPSRKRTCALGVSKLPQWRRYGRH